MSRLRKIGSWLARYERWLPLLWGVTAGIVALFRIRPGKHNNFTIFRQSCYHLSAEQPLYQPYPAEYSDLYLYGPSFAVLIAPIAVLPEPLSYLVWQLGLAMLFFAALRALPLSFYAQIIVLLFSLKEMISALLMMQFNIAIGAFIILSFACTERRQEHWAGLCIALGLVTKIYGIVGLAFVPLAARPGRLIVSTIGWTLLLLGLPYAFAPSDYVSAQYSSWLETLSAKNGHNMFATLQNISLLGILRKWTGAEGYSDLIPIGLGLALYALPFLRLRQYASRSFRLMLLSSTLLFVVLFSTGSEGSSYVICFPGIALWFLSRPYSERRWWDVGLILGVIVLSSLSNTDLVPRAIKTAYIWPLALKALFPSLVWFKLSYELLTVDYRRYGAAALEGEAGDPNGGHRPWISTYLNRG